MNFFKQTDAFASKRYENCHCDMHIELPFENFDHVDYAWFLEGIRFSSQFVFIPRACDLPWDWYLDNVYHCADFALPFDTWPIEQFSKILLVMLSAPVVIWMRNVPCSFMYLTLGPWSVVLFVKVSDLLIS